MFHVLAVNPQNKQWMRFPMTAVRIVKWTYRGEINSTAELGTFNATYHKSLPRHWVDPPWSWASPTLHTVLKQSATRHILKPVRCWTWLVTTPPLGTVFSQSATGDGPEILTTCIPKTLILDFHLLVSLRSGHFSPWEVSARPSIPFHPFPIIFCNNER